MSVSKLKPIDSTTLHERAYRQLKAALMTGMFRPGEPVTLRGLAEAFGTSVMPIRDAVRRLVSERALEMPSSRSVRVPLLSLRDFDNLVHLRVLLEGEAAALAASAVSSSEVAKIEQLHLEVAKHFSMGQISKFIVANQQLHFAIYAASKNPLLLSIIEILWLQGGPYLTLVIEHFSDEHARSATVDFSEHQRIVEALKKGDSERARKAIQGDILNAAEQYRPRLEEAMSNPDDERTRVGEQ